VAKETSSIAADLARSLSHGWARLAPETRDAAENLWGNLLDALDQIQESSSFPEAGPDS
jgi:hypothetical protein